LQYDSAHRSRSMSPHTPWLSHTCACDITVKFLRCVTCWCQSARRSSFQVSTLRPTTTACDAHLARTARTHTHLHTHTRGPTARASLSFLLGAHHQKRTMEVSKGSALQLHVYACPNPCSYRTTKPVIRTGFDHIHVKPHEHLEACVITYDMPSASPWQKLFSGSIRTHWHLVFSYLKFFFFFVGRPLPFFAAYAWKRS